MDSMFLGSFAKYINLSNFDTSNVTNMWALFGWNSNLETLDLSNLDMSKVMNMALMFDGCTSLTTVFGPINNINTAFDFSDSPLTASSAMVFINGLAEVSSAKTITFKSTTYNSLTPAQIAVATSKGWTVASA